MKELFTLIEQLRTNLRDALGAFRKLSVGANGLSKGLLILLALAALAALFFERKGPEPDIPPKL